MLSFHQYLTESDEFCDHGCFGKDGMAHAVVILHRQQKVDEIFGLLKKKKTQFFLKHDNGHIGSELSDVHKTLQKGVSSRAKEHHDAIKKYSQASNDLNEALYRSHSLGQKPPKSVHFLYPEGRKLVSKEHHVDKLDAVIAAHPIGQKLHVYTGVGFHPGSLAAQHPEGHLHLPAYTSTSIDKQVAATFADAAVHRRRTKDAHLLHIELPKDHPATYLGDHSVSKHEHEVLLGRHTRLKIHPEPEMHIDGYGKKIHVWKAKVVPHE